MCSAPAASLTLLSGSPAQGSPQLSVLPGTPQPSVLPGTPQPSLLQGTPQPSVLPRTPQPSMLPGTPQPSVLPGTTPPMAKAGPHSSLTLTNHAPLTFMASSSHDSAQSLLRGVSESEKGSGSKRGVFQWRSRGSGSQSGRSSDSIHGKHYAKMGIVMDSPAMETKTGQVMDTETTPSHCVRVTSESIACGDDDYEVVRLEAGKASPPISVKSESLGSQQEGPTSSPDSGYGNTPDNPGGCGGSRAGGSGNTPDNPGGSGNTPDNPVGYGNSTGSFGNTPDNSGGYGNTPDNPGGHGHTPDCADHLARSSQGQRSRSGAINGSERLREDTQDSACSMEPNLSLHQPIQHSPTPYPIPSSSTTPANSHLASISQDSVFASASLSSASDSKEMPQLPSQPLNGNHTTNTKSNSISLKKRRGRTSSSKSTGEAVYSPGW